VGWSDAEGAVLDEISPQLAGLIAGVLKSSGHNLADWAQTFTSHNRARCAANHGHGVARGAELEGLAVVEAESVSHGWGRSEWGSRPGDQIIPPSQPWSTPVPVALVTSCHIRRRYGAGMDDRHIQLLIDRAIREHELRVALWSGLLGLLLLLGTWHAIWMCR
jgi:hypothetical protein